jgi:Flp pilus assembly protein TadD
VAAIVAVSRPPGGWLRAATLAGLLALVVATFQGVLRNGWIAIDDPAYVLENPHVRGGWSAANALWLLSHVDCGNFAPLTALSHLLDVQLFGLVAGRHHAEGVAWHALNAVLLLLVLWRLTGAWWRSALVAALFAVHPLRVEPVAWASCRKDLLSTCCFLLGLGAWRAWTARPAMWRYALVVASLVLGLLAKPMLVTFPFVLLLLDAWPLGRLDPAPRRFLAPDGLLARLREKVPLFAIVAAFSLITHAAQQKAGALSIVHSLTFASRASNALTSYWKYVQKSFWPENLAVYYPHPRGVDAPAALLAMLVLAAVSVLAWRTRRDRPWLLTGWLWFVGTLVPVIGFVQFGPQAWADRFSYLPTIGLAIALAWEVHARTASARPARIVAVAAAAIAVSALAVASARQVARWHDTRTLFAWTAKVMPENTVVRLWLGDEYIREARPTRAIREYQAVLRYEPQNASVHDDLAVALAAVGRMDEAREHLVTALELQPSPEGWFNLGTLDARVGRTDDAIRELRTASEMAPDQPRTHVRLATVLFDAGHFADAAHELEAAIRLSPGDSQLVRRRDDAVAAGVRQRNASSAGH